MDRIMLSLLFYLVVGYVSVLAVRLFERFVLGIVYVRISADECDEKLDTIQAAPVPPIAPEENPIEFPSAFARNMRELLKQQSIVLTHEDAAAIISSMDEARYAGGGMTDKTYERISSRIMAACPEVFLSGSDAEPVPGKE